MEQKRKKIYTHMQSIKDKESWKQLTQVKVMRVGYAITKEGKQEVKQLKTHTVITRVKQEVGTRKERTHWENMNSIKTQERISVKPKQGQTWTNTKLKNRTAKWLRD